MSRAASASLTRRLVVSAVTMAAIAGALLPGAGPSSAATTAPLVVADAPRRVRIGVSVPGVPYDLEALDRFERLAGGRAGLVNYYRGFASAEFEPLLAATISERGSVPLITWEPWDYTKGVEQPEYALARIIDGTHDAYILRWATAIKAWGHRLMIRFAPEMNGNWNSWSAGVNGNSASDYVAAWRHVHGIFESVGATNVSWIWSPNVIFDGSTPIGKLYPGDAYVDWVGVDGYNWGTTQTWSRWQSFQKVFGPTLDRIRRITSKPIMISEVASAEAGGNKAVWIRGLFRTLRKIPEIKAVVWFNHNKETDWRIQSSRRARRAFAAGVEPGH